MTENAGQRLIVFTRYPEPGKTKTRLIPALGGEGAAELQRRMIVRTMMTARRAARRGALSLQVCYDSAVRNGFQSWLGPDLQYQAQAPGDLGERMAEAFQGAFAAGERLVVLIGTDIPELSEDILARAFASLAVHDLVLGPACDGGYYLIGLRQPTPCLFNNMAWSTGEVLERTLERARAMGLSVKLLEPLTDVDQPCDLAAWQRAVEAEQSSQPDISIIIPTLNEARGIGNVLAELTSEPGIEVIVADGGSGDATRSIAEAHGACVIETAGGRARQMNAGAALAGGRILLFLHADTLLPRGYAACVRDALRQPGVVAGAFSFRLDSHAPALRLIEWAANLRSRRLELPYGDQAIFMNTETFQSLQGYADLPLMEDLALVRRLKRSGRIVTLPLEVVTSARRWRARGAWKVSFFHLTALLAFLAGFSPFTIHRWFRWGGYYRADP